MSKEGKDQHHDIDFTGVDFEGIEREDGDVAGNNDFIEPNIKNFRLGLIYEAFVDCVRNGASSPVARNYFHAEKSCTLVIRCRDKEEKVLFFTALENVLDGSYRVNYTGERPEKSQAVNFDLYEDKNGKDDLLSVFFQQRRIFIFMYPGQDLPEEFQGFVDAEVPLLCTPEALESAVKKYVDENFWLSPQVAHELLQVPLSHLMTIFVEGRSTGHSVNLAYAYLKKRQGGKIARTRSAASLDSGPTLDDLHGLGAAGVWGRDLAIDFADWQAGKISWSDLDRGILLSGAPGTGKTTFAAALARTCGVNLIQTSMAQWQAKGHLGDYLKAMRRSFDDAQKAAPCILFLDEFDSAGDRNSKASDNDDYIRRAVNGLLECLDGSAGREGVVVVGATNHPDKIDAALRRPGRLDKLVEIPLPDAPARDGILRYHLRGDLDGVDLSPVVSRTQGMAGAWLEALVRTARRSARRARREMVLADLMAALPASSPMPAQVLAMSAVHEAGHAIIAIELRKKVKYAQVTREVLVDANSFDGGVVSIERDENECYLRSVSNSVRMIKQLLGGLAAEDIFLSERNDGGYSDLREATYWAARMWLSTGQQDILTTLVASDIDHVLAALKSRPDIQRRVEELLQQCMSEVKEIITRRRADVRKLADALVQRGRLSGDEINALLAPRARPRLRLLKSMQKPEAEHDFGEAYYECA